MATLLTTSKMDPALAARVDASVRGRRNAKTSGKRLAPRLVSMVRFGLVVVVAALVGSFWLARRNEARTLEKARAELLAEVHAKTASLTPADQGAVARIESWLERSSGDYEGDLVDGDLRAPKALAAVLARPAVYVRGPISSFASPPKIAQNAAASAKDALLVCLLEPPASHVERVMLGTVRIAYGRGTTMEEHTSNVHRLHDALVGLPFLLPPWAGQVSAAEDPADLARLARELRKAPIDAALQVMRASVLISVMDEPGESGGPTELDGERVHPVRITIVDLAAGKPVLRFRKTVDPTWISLAKKSEYANGLDSCGLALDVHDTVTPK
jgi:hypothetical protein